MLSTYSNATVPLGVQYRMLPYRRVYNTAWYDTEYRNTHAKVFPLPFMQLLGVRLWTTLSTCIRDMEG